MNLDQLGASFQQNRTAILGTAAAGVVGLALYRRKQAAAAPSAPTAGASTPGVYSAGGQTAGMYGANSYDSSASDVYGLVQPQLESLGGQISDLNSKLGQVPVKSAPPIASTLTGPSGTGYIVRYGGDGGLYEVQRDGSLYGLTLNEDAQQVEHARAAGTLNWQDLAGNSPTGATYNTAANLARLNAGSTSTS